MPIGNYTVGKSNIYIMVPKIGSTLYKMGNITVGEVTPDNTYVEHYISDRGARRKDKEVAVTKGINVTFTFDEINSTNLDRFVLGSLISPVSVVLNEETIECKAVVDFRTNVGIAQCLLWKSILISDVLPLVMNQKKRILGAFVTALKVYINKKKEKKLWIRKR